MSSLQHTLLLLLTTELQSGPEQVAEADFGSPGQLRPPDVLAAEAGLAFPGLSCWRTLGRLLPCRDLASVRG